MTWNSATDDAIVSRAGIELICEIDRVSKSKALFHRFKCLNYANCDQRPFEGYGPENQTNLQDVSRHYDPRGFFQRSMPGGFKLFLRLSRRLWHHQMHRNRYAIRICRGIAPKAARAVTTFFNLALNLTSYLPEIASTIAVNVLTL